MTRRATSAYDTAGQRKYLSRAEGHAFLAQAALRSRDKALFCLTLYYSGCRISEALNLRSSDIDASMRVLLIRSLKKRGKIETRRIPIPEFLTHELLNFGTADASALLWTFSRTTGWRIIKRVMQQAGIFGVKATSKGLRHGFGVRGAMGQVPLNIIQIWMGHADLTTTAIYLAVRDEEERALIEKTW